VEAGAILSPAPAYQCRLRLIYTKPIRQELRILPMESCCFSTNTALACANRITHVAGREHPAQLLASRYPNDRG
jgi:hypothetical protein